MRILHISPTYFDESSIIGGGERYPTELATWMAKEADTTLISFSSVRKSYRHDRLKIEIYPVQRFIGGNKSNPLSLQHLPSILGADVVHVHHLRTLISDMSCMMAGLTRRPTVVTDYGGGAGYVLSSKLPIFQWYKNAVAYSSFGLSSLPPVLRDSAILIKGGIDVEKFCPDPQVEIEKKILFVGRILPHKGINYLIDAFRLLGKSDYKLRIVGRVYSDRYYADLQQLAQGLAVEFDHEINDEKLLYEYRSAAATVLPSVHTSCYGDYTPVPELMGLTLLESQACGTPVVCTNAGAMHEFVHDGFSGHVVQQNSPESLASALGAIIAKHPFYEDYCREWMQPFGWTDVVQKHLALYQGYVQ